MEAQPKAVVGQLRRRRGSLCAEGAALSGAEGAAFSSAEGAALFGAEGITDHLSCVGVARAEKGERSLKEFA